VSAFANEPVLELRRAPVRAQLADALAALDAELPLRVPVMVGTGRREGDAIRSLDPCRSDRVVAEAAAATPEEVDRALELASGPGFARWSATPASERAAVLRRAAQILRDGRLRAAAMALRECGKPWPEADADVCEAIDFLEFYARGAVELDKGVRLLQVPGEHNELRYAPRGVVAVISPWNFPLAIPLGMAAAGLATGNAVVLKPAEQAPGCALILAEALREAGVPPEAFALLPGEGDVGAALVKDARVHTIAFTGSNAVGLEIVRVAAELQPGQKHLKRVVAEMGGKNCVIVDSDADLDEVVPALIESAFNYAGQKCSAAARVLVHAAAHDELLERLAGAVEVLEVGPAERLGIDLPAVIEQEALDRHARYAALAEREGRVVARAAEVPDGGFYAPPTLVADLPPDSDLLMNEIFAPLLTVERVRSVDEACDRIDAQSFALTGGLFCRNPETVDRVIARSPVGNLYVNRAITGAMVARQPFGGNRLSGTGTKAGGPGYLLQFVEPRVVTENTMRHGLVV
jgi:RHH-type transcriptional regulator, proline utilization regulon repressor / proline dehydrogenase / delta 1-pyrroline-5-carboxylate dehydrogenase